jgi:hypothetical protein
MTEMSPLPPSGLHRGPKSVFSLDSARNNNHSSVDSTTSVASAPAHFPACTPQQCQQTPHPGQTPKHRPPNNWRLMVAVKAALQWLPAARTAPVFDFRLSSSAAHANYATRRKANFDLQGLLMMDELSLMRPGSKFRPIFEGHPPWTQMKKSLSHGAHLELEAIPESNWLTLLDTAISYGNHKSASLHGKILLPQLQKEVKKGWHLPLPSRCSVKSMA